MKPDRQYRDVEFEPSEIRHEYGSNVHILRDPLALTELARLCSPELGQPRFNRVIASLYRRLLWNVANAELPRKQASIPSRMSESTDRGIYRGEVIDPEVSIVTVDIARGGIIPSDVCYSELNDLMDPNFIRQDHVFMSRVTDEDGNVTGAEIVGEKVGGSIDGRHLIIPDPMGATGSSMSRAVSYYREEVEGLPERVIAMNLIVTPEYIRRMTSDHPDVQLYALRLDRGMSPDEVLDTVPGEQWERESGLDAHDYIVPGGGGFGELMNNSWD